MAFTMQQYIEQHKLPIVMTDTVAVRLLHAHLKKLGFKRVQRSTKGKQHWVWVAAADTPSLERAVLIAKLKELESETTG